MTDSFPLQKTPPSALKLVMQNLEIIDIISLSLTSTKTRMALVPVNHPINFLCVHIQEGIFGLQILSTNDHLNVACSAERFGTLGFCFPSLRTGQELWSFPETDFRLWFLEMLRILNHPYIDYSNILDEADKLEKVVIELLKSIKIKLLHSPNLLVKRMLRKNADSLRWELERHPKQEFLIQNMSGFSEQRAFETKITIDDLLVSNSRCINLSQMYFPLKDYNRFLKCWIRGGTANLDILEVERYNNFEQMYGITIDEKTLKRDCSKVFLTKNSIQVDLITLPKLIGKSIFLMDLKLERKMDREQ